MSMALTFIVSWGLVILICYFGDPWRAIRLEAKAARLSRYIERCFECDGCGWVGHCDDTKDGFCPMCDAPTGELSKSGLKTATKIAKGYVK